MPYERNTRLWEVGDLVIHVGDAKQICMLMRVVGFTKSGDIQTIYHNPPHWMLNGSKKRLWANNPAYLLDPAIFGIALPTGAR